MHLVVSMLLGYVCGVTLPAAPFTGVCAIPFPACCLGFSGLVLGGVGGLHAGMSVCALQRGATHAAGYFLADRVAATPPTQGSCTRLPMLEPFHRVAQYVLQRVFHYPQRQGMPPSGLSDFKLMTFGLR